MSRTTLCLLTATALTALAGASMIFRYQVLGPEIHTPTGPGVWKVTLMVQGHLQGQSRLSTLTPLDDGRQRLLRESGSSQHLQHKLPDTRQLERHPERRYLSWSKRGGAQDGSFRACYEFFCAVEGHRSSAVPAGGKDLHVPPQQGEFLETTSPSDEENEQLSAEARSLTVGHTGHGDQAELLYRFVSNEVHHEPTVRGDAGVSAGECLKSGSGDSRAQARLLTALLRCRGIPARVVTGLRLVQDDGQVAHYWVEAWLHDHWLSMCPYYHHYGHVPASFLVFGYGDLSVVRGKNINDLDYAFLVERTTSEAALGGPEPSRFKKVLRSVRLTMLPNAEQKLVEFLLLLPIAALIICLYRNVIGLYSFGTFAPALVGLAFRDLHSLPGMLVFVSILLLGWLLRRLMDRYHLLQVPRIAFMLTMVVIVLITLIVGAHCNSLEATKYISLFPMVILTGMIERFWTLETEDGTVASFKTLLTTIVISATIAVVCSLHFVVHFMLTFPEVLGLIMSAQLLIGRYTGYRFTELLRFRDFLRTGPQLRLHTFDGIGDG